MAVKKGSIRHFRWFISNLAVNLIPALKRKIILYNRIIPAAEAGAADMRESTQATNFNAEEREFINYLPRQLPEQLKRKIACIEFHDKTLLGNTGALVDDNNQALISFMRSRPFVNYHDFRPEILNPVNKGEVRYFNMLGSHRGHRHLFHFLIDRMPQLYYALNLFKLAEQPLIVLINEDVPKFQRDLYRFISNDYPNVSFVEVPHNERWKVENLFHVDYYQTIKTTLADPDFLKFLKTTFMRGYGIDNNLSPTDRIYVCREDTKNRRFVNEQEIAAVFEEFGFKKILAGKLSFEEQIRTFNNAQYIAGIHGAGLTNILFSSPGARALEIFSEDHVKDTYFLLSRTLGQDYSYLFGGTQRRHSHFHLPASRLENKLRTTLSSLT
ncbi:glycosyltransferase family 61 protein [Solemya elarraichensis gill symbiont]|uniref:Glycosyltransferase 61 catalytic domain-containing protein n=1 Tax=Solemya elarraichensis gill symbiont TaxID=1918949 RepID=A0A1T2LCA6_9GAMM|nr:glycosyltransferase family 61 protein [Solemya elarraichensis gill symbiont]OOZ42729.1 hypothetical protein BOW52_01845 [Solemya elarraichensis gill symbiont]